MGSANINNRSTGFDTECDVAIEADDGAKGAETRAVIRGRRTALLAHWLGKPEAEFDAALAKEGSISGAIEAMDCGSDQRRLAPLLPKPIGLLASFIAAYHIGDPAGPHDSWRPWTRRRALERQIARMHKELRHAGLPTSVSELSPETV